MIYPDISLKEWRLKYPALEIVKTKCHKCRKSMITNKPFIEKDWIGLVSSDCSCGTKAISVSIINPKSVDLVEKFNNFFNKF